MKITRITTSRHYVNWVNWLFVRIETDEGLVGWGEASLHGAISSVEAAITELAPVLLGQDPSGPERHWHRLYNAWRWRGGAVFMSAMAGLDIALWDIEGKRLGVPVYRLLGGPHRTEIPVYASHWLQGPRTPENAHAGAREARRRGFRGFKWNPFTFEGLRDDEQGAMSLAVDMMAAAREGAGDDAEIYLECSELLSPRTARRAASLLAPYRPGWMEEPMPFENPRAMAELQRDIEVPVATGERLLSRFEIRELLECGGTRFLQPDIMHAGGFTEVRRMTALADTYYVPVCPHNPGGPICNAASLHLAASLANFHVLEQMEPDREIRDSASTVPIELRDGKFLLPEGPGLGLDPDVDFLAGYPPGNQPQYERAGVLYR